MNTISSENDPDFRPTSACTLSAIFDSKSQADSAVARLQDAGIPSDAVHLLPNIASDGEPAAKAEPVDVWSLLESWLYPEHRRAAYAEGVRRGGFLVSVIDVGKDQYEIAHDILDDEGSIDIDERADQWRRDGWSGGRHG